jgi:hypothetical protein
LTTPIPPYDPVADQVGAGTGSGLVSTGVTARDAADGRRTTALMISAALSLAEGNTSRAREISMRVRVTEDVNQRGQI